LALGRIPMRVGGGPSISVIRRLMRVRPTAKTVMREKLTATASTYKPSMACFSIELSDYSILAGCFDAHHRQSKPFLGDGAAVLRYDSFGWRVSMEGVAPMCDYSLHHVASRPAKVGDKLFTTDFSSSITRGFSAVGEPAVAVCLLPGTEIAFEELVHYDHSFGPLAKARVEHKVARFCQINTDKPHVHHDALEFPDGQIVMVTRLTPGQGATVLQLPAQLGTPLEASLRSASPELAEA